MTDIQILLRALAMYENGQKYKPSMASFLNLYSKEMKAADRNAVANVKASLERFFAASAALDPSLLRTRSRGFSVLAFESLFQAALKKGAGPDKPIRPESVQRLRDDSQYLNFTQAKTGDTVNVKGRLGRAMQIIELA
jgi:hypothetical protein